MRYLHCVGKKKCCVCARGVCVINLPSVVNSCRRGPRQSASEETGAAENGLSGSQPSDQPAAYREEVCRLLAAVFWACRHSWRFDFAVITFSQSFKKKNLRKTHREWKGSLSQQRRKWITVCLQICECQIVGYENAQFLKSANTLQVKTKLTVMTETQVWCKHPFDSTTYAAASVWVLACPLNLPSWKCSDTLLSFFSFYILILCLFCLTAG